MTENYVAEESSKKWRPFSERERERESRSGCFNGHARMAAKLPLSPDANLPQEREEGEKGQKERRHES